jgi:hypothetical protein
MLPGEPPHADDVAPRGTQEWRRAVTAHQKWVGEQLWNSNAIQGTNMSDPDSMKAALAALGIADEVGGGRHAYNMFMPGGALASEGFGVSNVPGRDGMAYALERFMPDWKFNLDRAIQGGMPRTEANQRFMPPEATMPGAASYPRPAPAPSGGGGPAPAPTGSFAAPSPSVAGIGSSESGGMAGGSSVYSEDDALKRARRALQQKGGGFTLGNLAEWH